MSTQENENIMIKLQRVVISFVLVALILLTFFAADTFAPQALVQRRRFVDAANPYLLFSP